MHDKDTLLVLGGTSEALRFVRQLIEVHRIDPDRIIYSIAGLVRTPTLSCRVVSGGFQQFGGLDTYLDQQQVTAIVDVTHPYAVQMTTTAIAAADKRQLPYFRYERPAWQPTVDDQWYEYRDWSKLCEKLNQYHRVFLSCGQLSEQQLALLPHDQQQQYWLRTAVAPETSLPTYCQWIYGIGPFHLDDEFALIDQHCIDVIVSKNSGGEYTAAKLEAARRLQIPVLMLARPRPLKNLIADSDIHQLAANIAQRFHLLTT